MIVKILIDSRESKLIEILNERDLDNYKDKIIRALITIRIILK